MVEQPRPDNLLDLDPQINPLQEGSILGKSGKKRGKEASIDPLENKKDLETTTPKISKAKEVESLKEFYKDLDKYYSENPQDPEAVKRTREENQKDLETFSGQTPELVLEANELETEEDSHKRDNLNERIEKIINFDDEVFGDVKTVGGGLKKVGRLGGKVAGHGLLGTGAVVAGGLSVFWKTVKLQTKVSWRTIGKIFNADWFPVEVPKGVDVLWKNDDVVTVKEIREESGRKKRG